ncbi:MAG: glycosyltransferase family 4 protein [Planctomycetota bacterium]
MDVLFLAHRAPFPPDKGDRLRAFHVLERLRQLGPVDLVAQTDSAEDAERARPGLLPLCREVHLVPRRRARALCRVGGALLSGGSLTLAWHHDVRVTRRLAQLCSQHDYGLVWGFSSGTGAWWRSARARHRAFDLCDLDALKWEALGRRERGPRGWLYRAESRRLLPQELALAAEADLVLLSTAGEAADLTARGGRPRRLAVLSNGTPWQASLNLPAASRAEAVFGFLGQMDYEPNVEAAVELARAVLPRVVAAVPGARLRILGRRPSAEVRALAVPGAVEVSGEVADVPAELGRLAVFAAPLQTGRGLANKIVEALAAGRPTVISPWAARALTGQPGRDYLVAEGAEATAAAIAGLLRDPQRRDALGQAGRAYVRAAHDWDTVLSGLMAELRQVVHA